MCLFHVPRENFIKVFYQVNRIEGELSLLFKTFQTVIITIFRQSCMFLYIEWAKPRGILYVGSVSESLFRVGTHTYTKTMYVHAPVK